MATPLDPRTLKAGQEYHRESISPLLGLDLDSNPQTIAKGRFHDLRNFRVETEGDLTLRTGYKQYEITFMPGGEGYEPVPNGSHIVAASEFVVEHVASGQQTTSRYHAIIWWDTSRLLLSLIDKAAETLWSTPHVIATGVQATSGNPAPTVAVCQYNTSLIVTVYDYATYMAEPASLPLTSTTAWNVTSLGKDLAPIPNSFTFAETTTADLLMYNNTDEYDPHGHAGGKLHRIHYVDDPATGKPQIIRLTLDAKYWLASSGVYGTTFPQIPWVPGEDDPVQPLDATYHNPVDHIKSRAWGYRFVLVQKRIDAKGNPVYRYSKPSVDLWVEDRIYCPPVLAFLQGGFLTFTDQIGDSNLFPNRWFDMTNKGVFWGDGHTLWNVGDLVGSNISVDDETDATQNLFPSPADFFDLQSKFRNLSTTNGFNTSDPYYFTARYLGWADSAQARFDGQVTPYKVSCSASELKRAPLTLFKASDFPVDWSVTEEILIFRTAHSEPNDADNAEKNPLFEPHKYGYVGSLKAGAIFTDDVADESVDFGNAPEQYDGFEAGQFSAQVVRDYQTKLVLGNTKTTYWVNKPSKALSWVHYAGPDQTKPGYDPLNFHTLSADGQQTVEFFFGYVDQEGNLSDLRQIFNTDNFAAYDPTKKQWVKLVLPRGYEPFITSLRVFESFYGDPGNGIVGRYYFELGDFPITASSITLNGNHAGLSYTTALPSKSVKDYYEPSQLIYSDPNAPMHWPELSIERAHPFAAITGMEVILGELWVFTTDSATLTILQREKPRVEEESRYTGAISRTAIQKWNKVVFFLSANGLYFAEGSGVVPFPAQVQSAVRRYLDEYISSQPRHANALRASLGMLAHRYELWLHFPSSVDLGGSLPQMTLIYKFTTGEIKRHYGSGMSDVENSQFDLTPAFALQNNTATPPKIDSSKYRSESVLFTSHNDGTLWANFADTTVTPGSTVLTVLNCDYPSAWSGSAYAEMSFAAAVPQSPKILRSLYLKAAAKASLSFVTGVAKSDGNYDAVRGHINDSCTIWPVTIATPGRANTLAHTIPSLARESKSVAPLFRIASVPDTDGNHVLSLHAIDVDIALKHHHPI